MKYQNSPWWLKYVNYFIQFFFIRLTRCTEREVHSFNVHSLSFTPHGLSLDGTPINSTVYEWYSIQYWIKPFAGWSKHFTWYDTKYKRITKKRIIS